MTNPRDMRRMRLDKCRDGRPSSVRTLREYDAAKIGSSPLETLPASRLIVPVGAIAIRWLLRMPWIAIPSRTSSGRVQTYGPYRYLSRS